MSELKILHLSDLHYDSSKPKDTEIVLNALWRDLENFKDIDFILFSGDMVKAGDKEDDFEKAFQFFINPLLEKTKLKEDNFFIAPGNHDIQLDKIKQVIELGLQEMLKDRDSLNEFLDEEMENDFEYIERLDHFNEFKTRFNSQHTITSNKLFSTHRVNKKNVSIGIACLNSGWRASGKGSGHDKGKLLIGERQIDASLKGIEKCDVKIALCHHPLDWLIEYDQSDAENRLSSEFDFILCGHLHKANIKLVQNFENKAVLVQGGCLYKGRSYYNGYSVVCFDVQKGKGVIYLRSYFDDILSFEKAVNKCKNGEIPINIKKRIQRDERGNDPEIGGNDMKGKAAKVGSVGKNKGEIELNITEKKLAKNKNFPPGVYIKCHGRPVRELVTSEDIYLQTEANEWISWTPDADVPYSLFNTQPFNEAFIDREEQLVLGLFEQNVARLKEGKWEYIQWNHTVLTLVETDIGIVVGDSEGNLGLLKAQGKTTPSLTVQEPVTDILNINNEKLVFLGIKGGLWTTEWPFDRGAKVKTINIKDFERIFGLIESKTTSGVILRGAARIALLDCESGKIENVSNSFEDSIRSVYANQGKIGRYTVLMDEGGLYLLSDDLKTTNMVKISIDEGRMAGVRPLHKGGFLAWTTDGNLFRVEENSTFKQIADNHVVLAFPHRDDEGVYIVRWHEVKGIHIQFEHKRDSKK